MLVVLGWNLTRNLPPNWWLEVTVARPTNVAHVLMSLDGEAFMIRVPLACTNEEAVRTVRESYEEGQVHFLVLIGVFWALPGELDWSVSSISEFKDVPDSLPNSY